MVANGGIDLGRQRGHGFVCSSLQFLSRLDCAQPGVVCGNIACHDSEVGLSDLGDELQHICGQFGGSVAVVVAPG